MGKKSTKKKSDSRGYCTVSALTQRKDTSGNDQMVKNNDVAEPKPTHTEEPSPHSLRVMTEISHLQRIAIGNMYKGSLFPPLAVEIHHHFSFKSRELLNEIIAFTLTVSAIPSSWQCNIWTYTRANRVLHALEGAGIEDHIACDAVVACSGHDERACVEWIIRNFPDKLPSGWCEYEAEAEKAVKNILEESEGEKYEDKAIVRSVSEQERVELLRRNQSMENQSSFIPKQRARQLLIDIQREFDERDMPCASDDSIPAIAPASPTSRYHQLTAYNKQLKEAMRLLTVKKEKALMKAKSDEVLEQLAELRLQVDLSRLRKHHGGDNVSDGDGERSIHGKMITVEGAETVGDLSLDGSEAARAVEITAQEVESGDELFGLFGGDDECMDGHSAEMRKDSSPISAAVNSSIRSEVQRVFKYEKSKMHESPQKLLSDVIQETRRFRTISSGAGKWLEHVEVGPLSSNIAKRISYAKGSVLSAQTDIMAFDQEGARHLACLKLLLLITAPENREKVARKLSPQITDIWNEWIQFELHEKLRKEEVLSELRVSACERSVEDWRASPLNGQSINARNVVRGSEEESATLQQRKKGMSRAAVRHELDMRCEQGLLKYEDIRAELPICKHADEVVQLIELTDVSIICGETGSGKSTQVPQLLLRSCSASSDKSINIVVTEPRRVATVSVSSRVGMELGDSALSQALTGYTVRLDSKVGPKCVLEYVTTGVLLRRIQATKGAILESYSHVIVDEVHERSVDSDLLLLLLKQYKFDFQQDESTGAGTGRFPRIVLMSATADAESISSYWANVTSSVATTRISGRTFPVEALFLEDGVEISGYGECPTSDGEFSDTAEIMARSAADITSDSEPVLYSSARTQLVMDNFALHRIPYDLILHIVRYELLNEATTAGAVLIFVPGMEEIRRVIGLIESCRELCCVCVTYPMHSSLSFDDLQRAFGRVERGRRKVIVSTNICETGVTIEDVDLVIDTGFVKSVEWNEVTELSRLRMHYCSAAESLQRRGRAGRVRPGRCYHLFPRCIMASTDPNPYSYFMKSRPDPEMARAPLTSPILNLIDQGFEPVLLLTSVGNIVKPSKLKNALQTLLELGAIVEWNRGEIDDTESAGGSEQSRSEGADTLSLQYCATPLGRMLAVLPCDPRSGKILLAARRLQCLPSAAVYVASLDCKNVFMRNDFSDSFFRDRFLKRTESDAAAIVNAYSEWLSCRNKHKWCRENGIGMAAMIQVDGIANDLKRALEQFTSDVDVTGNPTATCHTCRYNTGMHTCATGGSLPALHAAIATGMGNNIALRSSSPECRRITFMSGAKSRAAPCVIGRSSLVSDPKDWILYSGKMANDSGRQSLSNVSSITAPIALLFSPWTKFFIGDGTVILAGGIGVRCRPQSLVAIRHLKAAWERALCEDRTTNGCADLMKVLFQFLECSN